MLAYLPPDHLAGKDSCASMLVAAWSLQVQACAPAPRSFSGQNEAGPQEEGMLPVYAPFSTAQSAANLAGCSIHTWLCSVTCFTLAAHSGSALAWPPSHLYLLSLSWAAPPLLWDSFGHCIFLSPLGPCMSPMDLLALRALSPHAIISSLIQDPHHSFTTVPQVAATCLPYRVISA